jgi:hypothetical protein
MHLLNCSVDGLIYLPTTTKIDLEIKEKLIPKYAALPAIKNAGNHFSSWADARKTIVEDKVRSVRLILLICRATARCLWSTNARLTIAN